MARPDGSPRADGSAQGVTLVVAAAFVTQTGAAIAVGLFDEVGALGAVFLRLALAAVLLGAVVRPPLRAVTRQNVGVVLGFGAALGGMNMLIYQAIARLPLGVAVTIELLGPLVLSVVLSRRLSGLLWAGLALAGVLRCCGRTCCSWAWPWRSCPRRCRTRSNSRRCGGFPRRPSRSS